MAKLKKDKKGMIVWDELVKWILAIAGLALIVIMIFLFREKLALLGNKILEIFRFGR